MKGLALRSGVNRLMTVRELYVGGGSSNGKEEGRDI